MNEVSYPAVGRCPCCGSVGKIRTRRYRGNIAGHFVVCLSCGLSTRQYSTLKAAAEAWNRRPEDRLPEGLKNAARSISKYIIPLDPRARAGDPAAPYAFNTLTGRYYYTNEAVEAHNHKTEDIIAEDFLSDYYLQGG